MYHQFPSLADAFLNYFDASLVTTEKQREQVGRLRYRVYCEEFGFEPADAFPDGLETDRFDDHSMHCLITHRGSGEAAGCMRLIYATEERTLPIEDYCLESVYVDYLESLTLERDRVCEFSRLAVDSAFRRRPGEQHTRLGEFDAMDCSHQEQRTFSLISIATILAAFSMSSITGRTQIYTMMESNHLPRLLRRAGILMQVAGDSIEYHGERSAHFITTDLALGNMRDDLLVMYEAIHARLTDTSGTRVEVA